MYAVVLGCTNEDAFNYDSLATDDGSYFCSCIWMYLDEEACNFNNDTDGDGVCDADRY